MSGNSRQYEALFADCNLSLAVFIDGMKKFDKAFCEVMHDGSEYTLRLEVRGNHHKMIHCRVNCDSFKRPKDLNEEKELKVRGAVA